LAYSIGGRARRQIMLPTQAAFSNAVEQISDILGDGRFFGG
jgi:hypothetical protein